MNGRDWKRKSKEHITSARSLLAQRQFGTAYYLAGLSVECRLKSCICKMFKAGAWPDKDFVNKIHVHKLDELVAAAGLKAELDKRRSGSPTFAAYWATLMAWRVDARYRDWTEAEARDMVEAACKRRDGVLSWLNRHC